MAWSGGTYSRIYNWVADRAAGTNPQASRFDGDADDMAAGISACLHAGGQNAVSADISWGTNKITNLGDPTAAQDAATKAYVDSVVTTGDVKFSIDSTARTGWICYSTDDFTVSAGSEPSIGNASSTGTTRANADTADLFELLYDTYTSLVLYEASGTSPVSRGADAATDYAANRRLVLPDILGRTLGVAGTSGDTTNVPTARSTGDSAGAETHTLAIGEIPAHNHGALGTFQLAKSSFAVDGNFSQVLSGVDDVSVTFVNNGGGGAHNNQSPAFFMHLHMKL